EGALFCWPSRRSAVLGVQDKTKQNNNNNNKKKSKGISKDILPQISTLDFFFFASFCLHKS
ncbi:hypothetical protein, partial [Bacillus cereus group sp. Bc237]|uniref:hypothetical protein n=1 Tax=Bacillus cereus group sp. Bc237 TaxID=3018108 RepID=UPI003F28B0E0